MASKIHYFQHLRDSLLAFFLWDCRGKQGPQGPPGQDLTRIREGYIRGTVKGRDLVQNQNFQLSFDYTYIPVSAGYPGFWEPESGQPDIIRIFFSREGERGGSIEIALYHRRSTNTTWVSGLSGSILSVSGSTALSYSVSYPYLDPADTAYVANVNLRGDTLIEGRLVYVNRSKTPADTLVADFSSRLLRLIYYQRQARPSSSVSQSHSE